MAQWAKSSMYFYSAYYLPSRPLDSSRRPAPAAPGTVTNPPGNDTALITVGNLIDGPGRAVGRAVVAHKPTYPSYLKAVVAHNPRYQNGQKISEARPQTPSITKKRR